MAVMDADEVGIAEGTEDGRPHTLIGKQTRAG
jgi:hypothetical protein